MLVYKGFCMFRFCCCDNVTSFSYRVYEIIHIRLRLHIYVNTHTRIGNRCHLVFFVTCHRKGQVMKEKTLERMLVYAVRNMGGFALKFVSPGLAGVPDRLVLLPDGKMAFVEMKAPGQKPRPLQQLRHGQLRELGFRVYVINRKEQIGGVLDEIRTS